MRRTAVIRTTGMQARGAAGRAPFATDAMRTTAIRVTVMHSGGDAGSVVPPFATAAMWTTAIRATVMQAGGDAGIRAVVMQTAVPIGVRSRR